MPPCPAKPFARGLILSALGCLLIAAPATAANFHLIPSLSLTGEFNDNLFFEDRDEDRDWLTTAAAGFQLERRGERLQYQGTARWTGRKYLDNDGLDALDQLYMASGNYRWTPRLTVSGEAQYKRDSQPDRDLEETGLVLGTERRDSQSLGGGAQYALSERSRLSLGYRISCLDYEEDESADSDSHYLTLGWQYDLSERWKGLANLNYSHSDFTGSRIDNSELEMGFGYAAGEQWSLQATAGGRYTRSRYEELVPVVAFPFIIFEKQDASRSDWGWVGRLSASWQGERSQATLSLQRELRLASGQTGSTELTAVVLSARRHLSQQLSVSLAGGLYLNAAEANEFAGQGIDERTLSLSPALRYRWNEDLSLSLGYQFTKLQDSESDEDSLRNRAFLRLDYRYPLEF